MPNYPVYPQNYPQYPIYPQYQPYPAYPQPPQMSNAAPPVTQSVQPMQPIQQQAPVQTPAQSSIPISVRNEQQARDWPIAPGNSVTFIDETAGYVYTKTSMNQFDRPQFVKYRLVREDDTPQHPVEEPQTPPAAQPLPTADYALRSELDALSESMRGEIREIHSKLDGLPDKKSGTKKKEEPDNA